MLIKHILARGPACYDFFREALEAEKENDDIIQRVKPRILLEALYTNDDESSLVSGDFLS